jgi:hypothetical protein
MNGDPDTSSAERYSSPTGAFAWRHDPQIFPVSSRTLRSVARSCINPKRFAALIAWQINGLQVALKEVRIRPPGSLLVEPRNPRIYNRMLGFVDKRESQISWCLIQNRISYPDATVDQTPLGSLLLSARR